MGVRIGTCQTLHEARYNVWVHIVNYSEKKVKKLSYKNLDRLKEIKIWPNFSELRDIRVLPTIGGGYVVDAIS